MRNEQMAATARLALLIGLGLVSLASAAEPPAAGSGAKRKIVLISGKPSHGFGSHAHVAGMMLLAKSLNEAMGDRVEAVVSKLWPEDPKVLEGAAAVVVYCDGGNGHIALPRLKELDALADKGVGIGMIHYAVEVPKEKAGKEFLKWTGGYFETHWSVNPHWLAEFKSFPQHPVARGLRPFVQQDEWYYHMRFRPEMEGVTPILSAVPPDKTRQGKDGPHSGNPTVREGVGKNIAEHLLWVAQREGGLRGFGTTGGHHHKNWAHDDFRKAVLNAVVWIAHVDVPEGGVNSRRPAAEDLLANLDKVPENFDKAKLQKEIDDLNDPPKPPAGK